MPTIRDRFYPFRGGDHEIIALFSGGYPPGQTGILIPIMTQTPTPDHSLTSFDHVIIEKDKLLSKLRDNRGNHNAVYEAAVSGYWIEAKRILQVKEAGFEEAVTETKKDFGELTSAMAAAIEEKRHKDIGHLSVSFNFNARWPLTYPENHLEDYDRSIAMLEMSVADKVKLSTAEFNQYVRNDWSWTRGFAENSLSYVNSFVTLCSGMGAPVSIGAQAFTTGGYRSLLNG